MLQEMGLTKIKIIQFLQINILNFFGSIKVTMLKEFIKI